MNKIKLIVALVVLLGKAASAQDSQQLSVPLTDPGKPFKLEVNLTTGFIKLAVHSGKEILINASTMKEKANYRNLPNNMKRISGGDNLEITATENGNAITVGSNRPSRNIMLTIQIPQNASNIKLRTVNGGNIDVHDVVSDMELNNTNGGIYLHNVGGSAVVNTTNGHIDAVFRSVKSDAAMAFTSLNGDIDVTLPASYKGNLKARSDQGNVYCELDFVQDKSQPKVTKTALGGMYHLKVEDWIYGKINGGGPELMLKNMHGNIMVKKAK
ncbi:DUF4097 family beta strand repeat-containing protein [Mucilaginibacter myungsuensis]|uniref:DUF4097 family beta strand repeat protein n=1 Tax=Mucilaginibacter myungsuensis TaxID=649104 RepID=A0A929L107_9SPHI|nr:DUF4097 family beta strand repeat-containing protein [Mucilaginibacter myungsuensis]MBE9664270.1 DUF4097 family beta strand repeat protein [Mucilaginibacter myungsuensis]MDN3599974.1 DUF4097 family beta strand repeat-containing protein [Mucilaginibacter myungsuensis]